MDGMFLIDARKAFGPNAVKQFKENEKDDTQVTLFVDATQKVFERPMKDFRKFFEDEKVEEAIPDDKCVISFMTETKVLQILGFDFNWWIAAYRKKKYGRLDMLFDEKKIEEKTVEKQKKVKVDTKKTADVTTYRCACGIKKGGVIENIETFEGTQKEMTIFVNRLFQKNQIRSMFKATVVFCINYKFDSDLNDINNWFTLNELYDKGVFVK